MRSAIYVRFFVALAAVACFFGFIAAPFVERYKLPMRSALGVYLSFLLFLILLAVPGAAPARDWVRKQQLAMWVLPLLWCSPYLVYAVGTGDFRWSALLGLVGVAAVPPLLYRLLPVRAADGFAWQDCIAAVWLVAVLLGHQLAGVWNVPTNLDFMGRLFLVCIGSWTWVFVRPVPGLGYEFTFSLRTLRAAGLNFLCFAAIAIPASLAMHFTHWNPRHAGVLAFLKSFVEIFLFVALLEELFFRGFLQTLVSQNLRSERAGQALISAVFGLFHILHAPFPNWRYVLLATVAGWFYGAAFMRGGNLMASTFVHAMVDTVWRMFFSKN